MRTDLKKCGAHNLIHGDRETCPRCVETARARLHAQGVARVEEHQRNRRSYAGAHVEVSLGFATPSAEEIQEAFTKALTTYAPDLPVPYGPTFPNWKEATTEDILADLDHTVGTLAEQTKGASLGPFGMWTAAKDDRVRPEHKETPARPRSANPYTAYAEDARRIERAWKRPAVKALLVFFARLADDSDRLWKREDFDWSPARRVAAELAGYPGHGSVADLRRRLLAGETLTRLDMPLGVTLTQALRECFPIYAQQIPDRITSARTIQGGAQLILSYDDWS